MSAGPKPRCAGCWGIASLPSLLSSLRSSDGYQEGGADMAGTQLLPVTTLQLSWKNSTSNRTQDSTTCPAGQVCCIASVTSDCPLWVCPQCYQQQLNVPVMAAGCNVTLTSIVSMWQWNITARTCIGGNRTSIVVTAKKGEQ